jgi:hypothetical protein
MVFEGSQFIYAFKNVISAMKNCNDDCWKKSKSYNV